jgi:hypothetical protein
MMVMSRIISLVKKFRWLFLSRSPLESVPCHKKPLFGAFCGAWALSDCIYSLYIFSNNRNIFSIAHAVPLRAASLFGTA